MQYRTIEEKIEDAVEQDDLPKVVSLVRSYYFLDEHGNDEPIQCPGLFYLISKGAQRCATALLEGEIKGLTADVNDQLDDGSYALHLAFQWYFNYDLVELFIRHGARTDIRNEGTGRQSNLLPPSLHWFNYGIDIVCDFVPNEKMSVFAINKIK